MNDAKDLQHEADREAARKKPSVTPYLAILFSAALVLLVMAYFMQQRNNEATISGLTRSLSDMRLVDTLTEENEDLRRELDGMEAHIRGLETHIASQDAALAERDAALAERDAQIDALQQQLQALTAAQDG